MRRLSFSNQTIYPAKSPCGVGADADMPRRSLLAMTTLGAAGSLLHGPAFAATAPTLDQTPLQAIAGTKSRRFGSTINLNALTDPAYGALLAQQCDVFSSEVGFAWSEISPRAGTAFFKTADSIVAFAEAQGARLRGHPLVWDKSLPSDFAQQLQKTSAVDLMVQHIQTVAGRYGDRIQSWDVVNEAVLPTDGRPDALRINPFLTQAGPDYIVEAFKAARAAAPHAELVYNDWVDGYDNNYWAARRTGILKLLRYLKSKGAPIDAVGLESHLTANMAGFSPKVWAQFCSDIKSLGLVIHVTELTVADNLLPADIPTRDAAVAAWAYQYLSLTLQHGHVGDVIAWGLSDKYSSLARYSPRPDGLEPRGVAYDDLFRPKPLRKAIAQALSFSPAF